MLKLNVDGATCVSRSVWNLNLEDCLRQDLLKTPHAYARISSLGHLLNLGCTPPMYGMFKAYALDKAGASITLCKGHAVKGAVRQ